MFTIELSYSAYLPLPLRKLQVRVIITLYDQAHIMKFTVWTRWPLGVHRSRSISPTNLLPVRGLPISASVSIPVSNIEVQCWPKSSIKALTTANRLQIELPSVQLLFPDRISFQHTIDHRRPCASGQHQLRLVFCWGNVQFGQRLIQAASSLTGVQFDQRPIRPASSSISVQFDYRHQPTGAIRLVPLDQSVVS